jgi:hypothetical protein
MQLSDGCERHEGEPNHSGNSDVIVAGPVISFSVSCYQNSFFACIPARALTMNPSYGPNTASHDETYMFSSFYLSQGSCLRSTIQGTSHWLVPYTEIT